MAFFSTGDELRSIGDQLEPGMIYDSNRYTLFAMLTQAGVDIVVATPGRLLDHMQHPWARFEDLEFLVLDEADRMLDMGFLPDLEKIISKLPQQRQSLFFSATLPPKIRRLAAKLLCNPFSSSTSASSGLSRGSRTCV